MTSSLLLMSLLVSAVQGFLNRSNTPTYISSPAPQIKAVQGDAKPRRISVTWMDDASLLGEQLLIYDIEIYNTGQKKAVHNDSVKIRPELAVTHNWSWISPLPLECLQHSVRLRVRHDNVVSDWTDLRNVTGPGLDYSIPVDGSKVYPVDDIVMVNSNKIFCCIIPRGSTLKNFMYGKSNITLPQPVGQTYIFELTMQASITSGDDLQCETDDINTSEGISVFVTYSPEVHNFTCETRDLVFLECSWIQGNDKNLIGDRITKYTLNGSSVESPDVQDTYRWAININSSQGEVPWTLTAKNAINETSFVDTANPRHRVYLRAPQNLQALSVDATNARLEWQWPDANLSSLPMVCQVQIWLNNGESKRNTTGMNLHSVTLHDLQPYTSHSTRVRCASAEHFYKWGDWSKKISFQTKEDIPDNVDVWMTVDSNNSTFVVWKKLSVEKAHGKVTEYQLSWGGSGKSFRPTQHCYNMGSGISARNRINITASNSAGISQPSTIMTPLHQADVETVRVSGNKGALELSWNPDPGASCGYVVDWLPVGSQDKCGIKWKKIPAGHNSTTIKSELEDGVRYAFSLYTCTSSSPKLLRRWEGYGQEEVPSKEPPNVDAVPDGHNILLSWDEIPLENQRGFIQEYVINYSLTSHKNSGQPKTERVSGDMRRMQKRIQNLLPGTYEFWISALTSAGEGPAARTVITVTSQTLQIIVYSIISLGGVIILVLLFTLLCYQKRTWLKDKVYPDIPAPRLDFSDSKGIPNGELLKLPAEDVERLMAFPINMNKVNLKVTHNVYSPLYRNVLDSQQSQETEDDLGPDVEPTSVLLDNLTYNVQMGAPEVGDVPLETTEGYKPQLPEVSSHLAPCSASSYQDLENVDQCDPLQSARDSRLESDDYIAVSVVGSPASVSSSQPLLGEPYKHWHGQHT